MKNDINIERSIKHIDLYQDKESRELLKKHLDQEKFFVDDRGMVNYSSETIHELKKIKIRRMTPKERVKDLQISHLNTLNLNLDAEYDINDKIVLLGVFSTIRSIKQTLNKKSDFWNAAEKYIKSLIK